jgi:hypothetical protein
MISQIAASPLILSRRIATDGQAEALPRPLHPRGSPHSLTHRDWIAAFARDHWAPQSWLRDVAAATKRRL